MRTQFMPSPASRSASLAVKNEVSSRSKKSSARSSPSTPLTAARIEVSLAGWPVMKFSMFIQPPRPTPLSRTGVPLGVRSRVPETCSMVTLSSHPR
ncbi:hypothetical protein [Nonomuraea sp. NPDC052265]|uniref:hypothetical protein n=1 Tax=Nonomuraea sp. NPDC052265 TaxID=3364374 RepID=UPI0037CBA3AD